MFRMFKFKLYESSVCMKEFSYIDILQIISKSCVGLNQLGEIKNKIKLLLTYASSVFARLQWPPNRAALSKC